MDAAEQFQQMLAAGVQFRVAGDRLGIKAPVPLTDEQRAWVRQHKTELIRQVESQTAPDLHGWTLGQIRDHCHPAEWAEIKDNRLALECVAADLRRHPFLWSPSFRGCYENHQNRPDEDVDGSVEGGLVPHGASTVARATPHRPPPAQGLTNAERTMDAGLVPMSGIGMHRPGRRGGGI